MAGWLGNVCVWLWFNRSYPYVQEPKARSAMAHNIASDSFLSSVGLGFWVSVVAVLCIWLASRSIRSGELTMPLRFSGGRGADDDLGSRKVAWMMVVFCMPATALASLIGVTIANPSLFQSEVRNLFFVELYTEFMTAIPFLGLLIFAVGTDAAGLFRRSLKLPPLGATTLGIAFPLLMAATPRLVGFAVARVHWAQTGYGQTEPPRLFGGPEHFRWEFLVVIISALAEEIAWRGYLQPRLISRYGMYRGIFFVGIVWGAFHFPSDFSASTHPTSLATQFAGRLFNCVAWGFVLSWLTLRADGSVIPAGVSHGLMNAFYFNGWMNSAPSFAIYALWAVLAVALFRFWPPRTAADGLANAAPDACSDRFGDTSDVAPGTS